MISGLICIINIIVFVCFLAYALVCVHICRLLQKTVSGVFYKTASVYLLIDFRHQFRPV